MKPKVKQTPAHRRLVAAVRRFKKRASPEIVVTVFNALRSTMANPPPEKQRPKIKPSETKRTKELARHIRNLKKKRARLIKQLEHEKSSSRVFRTPKARGTRTTATS